MKNLFKIILAFGFVFCTTLPLFSGTVKAKQTSYLMNTKYIYNYQYGNGIKFYLEFWKKEDGYYKWSNRDFGTAYKETKTGLYQEGTKILAYPIKSGKRWSEPSSNSTYTIKSTNRTIKTSAGTFTKVVEVRETVKGFGFHTSYFAPGKGVILSTTNADYNDFDTEIHYKLIKIKKK
ncbi:hypothetical protein [Peribacillus glennii]|uniref:Uncharacterized protein n=1 Tax=Peribacillus glennii TaxID=2303991 RepID=A0A372LGS0_9BACI|nr:hypothetical protein [Peribacillus glennii]RFU65491.1 hypothetical protein D0466_06280 [Peribacillus glennii]